MTTMPITAFDDDAEYPVLGVAARMMVKHGYGESSSTLATAASGAMMQSQDAASLASSSIETTRSW